MESASPSDEKTTPSKPRGFGPKSAKPKAKTDYYTRKLEEGRAAKQKAANEAKIRAKELSELKKQEEENPERKGIALVRTVCPGRNKRVHLH